MMAVKQSKNIIEFLGKELSEYMKTVGHLTAEEKKDLLEWMAAVFIPTLLS